jgi:hypothetical protein
MIDKSIRQYYSRGQLVKPGPGRPGYQGPAGGSHGSYGGSSSPSRGGGGGGGGHHRDDPVTQTARPYQAPKPAPKPAPTPYAKPDPVTEVVSGDKTFEPVEKYTPPLRNIHEDTKETLEEQRQLDIQQMIAKQQEEKYGPLADPTKFGETVEGPDLRTEKEKGEDWERAQDWDKVKDLSKKGYDFKEIQDAMEKGLLTKADPQSMKTNLLGRGLRSLRNIMPGTGLERSLLSNLTKNVFSPTEGGLFNLKGMATGALKSMALKKLGLGALNPFLGIASLFGFDPFKSLTNKFARKPAFDMEAASKLGLHANRFPTATDTMGTLTAKDAYKQPISTQIAKGGGLEKGYEMLGIHPRDDINPELKALMAKGKSYSETDIMPSDVDTSLAKFASSKTDAGGTEWTADTGMFGEDPAFSKLVDDAIMREEDKYLEKGIIPSPFLGEKLKLQMWNDYKTGAMGPAFKAHGGRIDKPLTGRRRDI